jgi:hypothetical protein
MQRIERDYTGGGTGADSAKYCSTGIAEVTRTLPFLIRT